MSQTICLLGLNISGYYLFAAIGALLVPVGIRLKAKALPKGMAAVLGLLGAVLGVLFGRGLYYAVNWNRFLHHLQAPAQLFAFGDGSISITGVIAGYLLAALITAKLVKTPVGVVMDALAVPFCLLIAMLRLGEQFTSLGVGAAVDEGFMTEHFPWLFLQSRMGIMVEYRLNVWLYQAVAAFLIFDFAVLCCKKFGSRAGNKAIAVFSLYGACQILLESMRDDGHMMVTFLRIGQLGAALLPVVCCIILSCREKRKKAVLCAWLLVALAIAAVTVLEFSLDGRLTFGTPTLLRDWGLMSAACALLFAAVCALLHASGRQKSPCANTVE